MLKKSLLLFTALLFAVCAHLRPVYTLALTGGVVTPACGVRRPKR